MREQARERERLHDGEPMRLGLLRGRAMLQQRLRGLVQPLRYLGLARELRRRVLRDGRLSLVRALCLQWRECELPHFVLERLAMRRSCLLRWRQMHREAREGGDVHRGVAMRIGILRGRFLLRQSLRRILRDLRTSSWRELEWQLHDAPLRLAPMRQLCVQWLERHLPDLVQLGCELRGREILHGPFPRLVREQAGIGR